MKLLRRTERHVARIDVLEIASMLLRYPDEELFGALAAIDQALSDIPGSTAKRVREHVAWMRTSALRDVQADYCETFDFDRRGSLHLTWFQYGDRRQRGIVLLKLKHTYRALGFEPVEEELPDYLPLMLEFAVAAPNGAGLDLLQQWRAGVEVVRRAMHERDRRWACVLDLVSEQLPRLGGDIDEQVKRLLAEGPPDEEVGMEPFGDPASAGWQEPYSTGAAASCSPGTDITRGAQQ